MANNLELSMSSTSDGLGGGGGNRSSSPLQDMLNGHHPKEHLECDYDINCIELYTRIEHSQWEKILENSEHFSSQASVWVVRKEGNGRLKWRLLPLHAALVFRAPYSILELLLESYPHAASQKDDQGNLPLHLALRNEANWEIVEELLTVYPTAVLARDRKGRTPLEAGLQCQKNADKKSALAVIELFCNIKTAKISSEVKHNTLTETDQQIKALQSQHLQVLNTLKDSFYAQQEKVQCEHERVVEKLTQQLDESRYRLQACQEQQLHPDTCTKRDSDSHNNNNNIHNKNNNHLEELLKDMLESQRTANEAWKQKVEQQSQELKEYHHQLEQLLSTQNQNNQQSSEQLPVPKSGPSTPPRKTSPRPRGPVVERRVEELESYQKRLDELLAVRSNDGEAMERQHHSCNNLEQQQHDDETKERRIRRRSLADEILDELDASPP